MGSRNGLALALVLPVTGLLVSLGCDSGAGGSDSACLHEVASWTTPGVLDVTPGAMGEVIAVGYDGLAVLDVGVPTEPVLLGQLNLPGTAQRVAVQGSWAAVACESDGVQLVSLADPSVPVLLAQIPVEDDAADVALLDGVLAVADESQGVHVYLLDEAGVPTWQSTVHATGEADTQFPYYTAVALEADRLYFLSAGGLSIVDLSNPAQPQTLSQVDVSLSFELLVADGMAYCEDTVNGRYVLRVVDCRNPAQPVKRGSLLTSPFSVDHVALQGDELFISGSGYVGEPEEEVTRLIHVHVSNPDRLLLVEQLEHVGAPAGLCVLDGQVYAGRNYAGFAVYGLSCE